MKKIISILLLFLFVPCADAYDMTIYVRDINTKLGIPLANISIYEPEKSPPVTVHYFKYTNDQGFVTIYDEITEHYTNVTAVGYYPLLDSHFHNVTNDSVMTFWMYPISTEGLIKVRWTDDTVNMDDRRICVFYDNDRLNDCFLKNETIWLQNNKQVTFKIESNFWDNFSSIESLWINKFNLIPYLGIMLFLLFLIFKVVKKR